jgi:5'-deoxynucleotidase YfbR-like HD superfamily hydrolase
LKENVEEFNKEVLKHSDEILTQKSKFANCVRTANDHLDRAIENLNYSNGATGTAKTETYNKAL